MVEVICSLNLRIKLPGPDKRICDATSCPSPMSVPETHGRGLTPEICPRISTHA